MNRRHLLAGLATLPLWPSIGLAGVDTEQRLLLVLLRGGLDGLAALPPVGDPNHARARGSAAVDGKPLDDLLGLHPALEPLRPWWTEGCLAALPAVGVTGGGRSHFDAQDVLDNGTERAQSTRTGWLNRAVSQLGSRPYALGRDLPLMLHGPSPVGALDPSRPIQLPRGHAEQLATLWHDHPLLSSAFARGLESQALLAKVQPERQRSRSPLDDDQARTLGALLAHPDGPRIGVFEAGGWDTHTNQSNTLDRQLAALASGLLALRQGLGTSWSTTTVIVVSEFGRTVQANGSKGTDHGTAGLALLAGGAVHGGRRYGDWPGLRAQDLHEGRDLRTTTEVRTIFMGALASQFRVQSLSDVFPESDKLTPFVKPFRT